MAEQILSLPLVIKLCVCPDKDPWIELLSMNGSIKLTNLPKQCSLPTVFYLGLIAVKACCVVYINKPGLLWSLLVLLSMWIKTNNSGYGYPRLRRAIHLHCREADVLHTNGHWMWPNPHCQSCLLLKSFYEIQSRIVWTWVLFIPIEFLRTLLLKYEITVSVSMF